MFRQLSNNITSGLVALALLFGIGGAVLMQPDIAGAAPVDVLETCKSGKADSEVCKGTNKNSLFDLIQNIINLLLMAIGIIAVIMIIIGGIRYTTSAGDPGQAKSARDTIVYAVVGLVIAVMSYAIVNFVLAKL
jgi:hypothetical protein